MPTEQRVAPVRGAHRLSPEFWAIIGIGVTVLIGLGAGQMGVRDEFRGEIKGVRDEFRGEIKGVRGEIQGVRGEVQSLRDDHREDFMLLLQEIREVRELVVANGKVLARIEQALFGPPAKVTPADREYASAHRGPRRGVSAPARKSSSSQLNAPRRPGAWW